MVKFGASGLTQVVNQSGNNNFNTNNASNIANLFISVRVLSIVLDDTHPRFKELGEWNGLGTIEYEVVNNPALKSNIGPEEKPSTAVPLAPNLKNYPLVNEIVYIVSLPSTEIGNNNSAEQPYYINVVGLWNHPHHNAYPKNPNNPPPSQKKDYVQTQAGSVRRVTDNSTEIFLGKTFYERSNIHPLLPFEGDVIYEGRWGNSIRLGSTVSGTPTNDWSNTGTNGDPITIIRNGQSNQITDPKTEEDITEQGWIPTTENINKDNSSIYLTSTQNIPVEAASTNYLSYNESNLTPPTTPSEYEGKQIILNSGRLLFNASEDHLLLSSVGSINLNSAETVNIDTRKFIVKSDKIYLGPETLDAQPLLKGDNTYEIIKELISCVQALTFTFKTLTSAPVPPFGLATFPQLLEPMDTLSIRLKEANNKLSTIKSNYNYTI